LSGANGSPRLLIRTPWDGPLRVFSRPIDVIETRDPRQVRACLAAVDAAVRRTGACAAGFVAYEAAAAFGLPVLDLPDNQFPLLWFGIFPRDRIARLESLPVAPDDTPTAWTATLHHERYLDAIRRIRGHIEAGETYQINFTWRLRSPFEGDPLALFARLDAAQRGNWSAYVDIGRHAICSASPELFFALDGTRVECRPMKGTAPRGLSSADDEARAEALKGSAKNRAENVMVVDMTRNDLGRIARVGSVRAASLYDLERYPGQWQMVSSVTAEVAGDALDGLFGALFPSGSVTGAPKHRSMAIITEVEGVPRGIYTGAIGLVEPGRAHFNVAIRTVHVDRAAGVAEFGVGGGIVWDSVDRDEYDECLVKASILTRRDPEFELLESIGWDPAAGFALLPGHLERLAASAAYFGFPPLASSRIDAALARSVEGHSKPAKIRLRVARDGTVRCDAAPIVERTAPLHAVLASEAVDVDDVFLYHKTTMREVYEKARRTAPTADAVILWNARGEITEATDANVVIEIDGRKVTPPVECGLLPGVKRAQLLAAGEIVERRIAIEELRAARGRWLINSVRGWLPFTMGNGRPFPG
jgi:para-aminobenzoate synthetase/4-amino-4-deoxychorismate lyase